MEASCACGHAVRGGFGRAAGRHDAGTVRTAPADPGGVLDRVGGRLGRCGSLVQPELHLHAGSQGRCCYRVAQARRHPAERRAARGRAQRMGEERRWLDGVGRERVGGRLLLFDARRRSFPEGRRGLRHLPAQLRDHDLRQRVRPHRGRRLRRADRAQRLAHAGRELLFRRRWPRHGRRADRATVREAQRDRARRGDHLPLMTTAGLGGAWALLGLAVARPLAAQLPQADEAFRRGDYRAARAGYERELAADSLNERALYRLAILDSWDGKLARSLARFARLRRLEAKDEDIRGARAAAPGDRTARELQRLVRAALRPEARTTVDGAGDSDDNAFVAQEGSLTMPLGGDLRGTVHAGWRHATRLASDGTSYGGGGYVVAPLGKGAVVRAGLGVRRLVPDVGPARTPVTAQVGLGIRPARYAAASLGYSRTAFDETALLIERGFVIDAVDLSFDVSPSPDWSVSGGGGGAWIADGNRRYSAGAAGLARGLPGRQIGPFARILGDRTNPSHGYFAPDRFSVIEARLVYALQRSRWGARLPGGVGTQQVFKGAPHQTEWHVGAALSRGWGANNEIAVVGSITNSAGATSTAGVRSEEFRYRALGLRFTQGL